MAARAISTFAVAFFVGCSGTASRGGDASTAAVDTRADVRMPDARAILPDATHDRGARDRGVAPVDRGRADRGSPCPAGATCFVRAGVVHAPSRGNEVKRLSFRLPPATYRRIQLTLSVKHGGWATGAQAVRHNIFWLAHNKRNFDLYAYPNFVKPNTVLFRHGVGQAQGAKAKVQKKATLSAGATYDVALDYDTRAKRIDLKLTSGGRAVAQITHTPNTPSIVFKSGQTLDIDFGFDGKSNPQEPATYGWVYRDLRIVLTR